VSSSCRGRAPSHRPSLRFAASVKARSSTHVGRESPVEGHAPLAALGLGEATQQLVDGLIAGAWPELQGQPWLEVRNFLLSELLRRCPGFSTREYRRALSTQLSGQAFKRLRFV
jgi:hypothetical protein